MQVGHHLVLVLLMSEDTSPSTSPGTHQTKPYRNTWGLGPASFQKNLLGLNADHSSAAFPLPLVGSNSDRQMIDESNSRPPAKATGSSFQTDFASFCSSNYAAVQSMHHRVVLLARKKSATVDCHLTLPIANLPWQNAS
jgi:hypothetical protein